MKKRNKFHGPKDEAHYLMDLLWPVSKKQNNKVARYFFIGKRLPHLTNWHFSKMKNEDVQIALAFLREKAWRKGVYTPPAIIL